jgi:K+-sensing histidine kinase KdpD
VKDSDGSPGQSSRADAWERDVLRIVGHDLRGPLATILGWARILHHKHGENASIAEAVATIERNVDTAITLVDDVCARLVLRRGTVDLTPEPLDLDEVCRLAVQRARPRLGARRLTLTHEPAAGAVVVNADPIWMQRIVRSLLTIAIKLTPRDGHIVLRTERHGAVIRLSLATPSAAAAAAFELDVEREVIALHGGSVSVAAGTQGSGWEVTVELPAHRAPTRARVSAASARRGRRRR